MKAGRRRMLYFTCFVTVFLLSGPVLGGGCLGKSPGERRLKQINPPSSIAAAGAGGAGLPPRARRGAPRPQAGKHPARHAGKRQGALYNIYIYIF